MKHKITLKRKDTGETLTIWSVFDNSGDCVEMQRHTDNETVPVEIEVLDHKLMFPGCTEEETIKMTEKVIRSGDLDNMIKSANEIFKMISEKLKK